MLELKAALDALDEVAGIVDDDGLKLELGVFEDIGAVVGAEVEALGVELELEAAGLSILTGSPILGVPLMTSSVPTSATKTNRWFLIVLTPYLTRRTIPLSSMVLLSTK